MIKIDDVTVAFGEIRALDHLTVDLKGDAVGVFGAHGAGKTTLLNVLSGEVEPVSGAIKAFDIDLLEMPGRVRARWGLRRTFPTPKVLDELNIWDNVAAMLNTAPINWRDKREQVRAALGFAGLEGAERRMGQDLTPYERRMTEITRTIVGEPRLILMDEPSAGLSPTEIDKMSTVIKGIHAFCGAMTVIADEDERTIAATCATTAVLDTGSLLAYGKTAAVLRDAHISRKEM